MKTFIDIKKIGDHYHAQKIMTSLAAINPDFYPIPVVPAIRQPDGSLHVGRKTTGYMNRPGFSRHFRAVRNIAFHTLLAIAH
ncbi:hypothetical protein, partial [Aeromonas sp. 603696]|uniref:hypothetical protein n=1 Tax=Aeromonas sp. 603696 TaxID=2712049 RepID=UPI003BA0EBE6